MGDVAPEAATASGPPDGRSRSERPRARVPVASVGAGEAAMIRILRDLLVFACLAMFVTGIVLAAAKLLI